MMNWTGVSWKSEFIHMGGLDVVRGREKKTHRYPKTGAAIMEGQTEKERHWSEVRKGYRRNTKKKTETGKVRVGRIGAEQKKKQNKYCGHSYQTVFPSYFVLYAMFQCLIGKEQGECRQARTQSYCCANVVFKK